MRQGETQDVEITVPSRAAVGGRDYAWCTEAALDNSDPAPKRSCRNVWRVEVTGHCGTESLGLPERKTRVIRLPANRESDDREP